MVNYRKLYKTTSTCDLLMIINEGIQVIEEVYGAPRRHIKLRYESNQA